MLGRKWQYGFLKRLMNALLFLEWEGFDVTVEEIKRDS
jgi:hypothetical protein